MRVEYICNYCDFRRIAHSFSMPHKGICTKCKSTDIKFDNLEESRIDYYVGCPPFEKGDETYYDGAD